MSIKQGKGSLVASQVTMLCTLKDTGQYLKANFFLGKFIFLKDNMNFKKTHKSNMQCLMNFYKGNIFMYSASGQVQEWDQHGRDFLQDPSKKTALIVIIGMCMRAPGI